MRRCAYIYVRVYQCVSVSIYESECMSSWGKIIIITTPYNHQLCVSDDLNKLVKAQSCHQCACSDSNQLFQLVPNYIVCKFVRTTGLLTIHTQACALPMWLKRLALQPYGCRFSPVAWHLKQV